MSNELASSQQPVSPAPPSLAACKRKAGRKKFRETRHPVYRGVRSRNGAKWVCEVREPVHKTRIWLGTYRTPELAARAHDVAALALKGDEEARLNFRDSAWLVPRAESCSAQDIRAAALKVGPMTSSLLGSCPGCADPKKGPESREGDVGMMMSSETEVMTGFWDEEAVFNMPALMDRMAEAMLLTPPAYKQPSYFSCDEDHDFNLWGY